MGFTVTRPVGTKDAEFENYVRVLRQQGKGLANLPRVPDPLNPRRRWVHVWNTRDEAQHFADELAEQTGENGWHVEPTDTPPSVGPFGPILIHLVRRATGSILVLDLVSAALIRETFPGTRPGAIKITLDPESGNDLLKTQDSFRDLIKTVAPVLTGLTLDQLTELGYAVIDADTHQTWLYVPPASVANGHV